jgi:hypothetical protein
MIILNEHLLGQRPPLDSEDNAIFASHADGRAASSNGFHCIFHLEEMPVRTEYCDGTIIRHVDCCYLLLSSVIWRLYSNDIYCYLMSIAFDERSMKKQIEDGRCDTYHSVIKECYNDTKHTPTASFNQLALLLIMLRTAVSFL